MSDEVGVVLRMNRKEAEAFKLLFPKAMIIEPKKKEPVKAPTKEEVMEFCKNRNSPTDPLRFYSYYSERGWARANGESILPDWKGVLLSWEEKDKNKPKPQQKPSQIVGKESMTHSKEIMEDFYKFAEEMKEQHEARLEAEGRKEEWDTQDSSKDA